jgi:hypothetical protein
MRVRDALRILRFDDEDDDDVSDPDDSPIGDLEPIGSPPDADDGDPDDDGDDGDGTEDPDIWLTPDLVDVPDDDEELASRYCPLCGSTEHNEPDDGDECPTEYTDDEECGGGIVRSTNAAPYEIRPWTMSGGYL